MHICYFSAFPRGIDYIFESRFAPSLKSLGITATFISSDCSEHVESGSIKYISSGFIPRGRYKQMFLSQHKLLSTIRNIDADVYQTSDMECLPVCRWLLKRGKKVIFFDKEGHPDTILKKKYFPTLINRLVWRCIDAYMGYCLKRCALVLTVTDDIRIRYELRWGLKNVSLLHNFPHKNKDIGNFSYDDYCQRDDRVVYLGLIYDISCQEIFMAALDRIPVVKYFMAGKFCNDTYRNKITSLEYWNKVEFLDGFSRSDIPAILSKATISNCLRDFNQTSSPRGSLGVVKIFESMEAGLPVILSDVEIYRELIEKYGCGICVDPYNLEDIERALLYLIDNKKEAYAMGQNGRRAVLEEYNWEKQFDNYINQIYNIL